MPRRKKDPRGFVRETGTYMGKHYDLRAKTEKKLNEKIRAKRAENPEVNSLKPVLP